MRPDAPVPVEPQTRFDDLVGLLNAIVWEADGDDYRMTFVSPMSEPLTGYTPTQWMTEPEFWERRIHPEDRARVLAETDAAISAMRSLSIEYRFRLASGEYTWFSDVIRVVPKRDGAGHRLVGVMIDITGRKRLEAELAFRASHDPLTGLLNRDQLDVELTRVTRCETPWALLFLDLDSFKTINDGLGHSVGDEVLRVVAQRLRHAARGPDLVARFGGDEFAVLAPASGPDATIALARRLRDRVREPIASGELLLTVGASVGVAYLDGHDTPEAVLRDADAAMYWAKEQPTGVAVFEPWMHEEALRRLGSMAPGAARRDGPLLVARP